MTTQLPAHLANRQQRQLTDAAFSGMAGALPPHISIRSNRFTLVGADGARQTLETTYLHVCFVDVSEAISKLYYEQDFQDGNDDPPTCWSANGVAPSREAVSRQARTCAECQWNVRGSEVSKLSGKAIKACRDEKWTAITLIEAQSNAQGQLTGMRPLYPEVLWQLRVTPGSFKNWRGFVERCKSQGVDMSLLVTRIAFEADKNGVLTFQPVSWIDAAIADVRDKAWESKATDTLVGRNDKPILEAAPEVLKVIPGPNDATLQQAVTERKRGRPAKQTVPNGGQQAAPVAPFRPESPPQAASFAQTQPTPNFGIQQPSPAPAALNNALDEFFGPQK